MAPRTDRTRTNQLTGLSKDKITETYDRGDQHMLDQAKWHFDCFYTNNVDNTWDGGMWRERGVRNQKDVPTNGYAIVAAQLAKSYPTATVHNNLTNTDRTYLQIAQDIYSWIKAQFLRTGGGMKNSILVGQPRLGRQPVHL
ncbi:hypothetical protein [Stigmatella aurantiaca]|uniref:Uncharacterized protein n=1 Tax=Stigmatella aurantiaca (strain DW4/3-1) TaxID=378806 RepID=Q096I3_STIAD|nr:hypothetical protein [Stigmatella aurantiaca]ADO68733.1 uncharacterized protein STAUR_0929 [Stigmatella aurantiaca DW4/3-1]EAU67633.1 hypothetical protein STIAU_0625 [Stigmatella aurantiaca DW4/3-1]